MGDKLRYKQAKRQKNWHTDNQTDKKTDKHADRLTRHRD